MNTIFRNAKTVGEVDRIFRRHAAIYHPNKGGTKENFQKLQSARDRARAALNDRYAADTEPPLPSVIIAKWFRAYPSASASDKKAILAEVRAFGDTPDGAAFRRVVSPFISAHDGVYKAYRSVNQLPTVRWLYIKMFLVLIAAALFMFVVLGLASIGGTSPVVASVASVAAATLPVQSYSRIAWMRRMKATRTLNNRMQLAHKVPPEYHGTLMQISRVLAGKRMIKPKGQTSEQAARTTAAFVEQVAASMNMSVRDAVEFGNAIVRGPPRKTPRLGLVVTSALAGTMLLGLARDPRQASLNRSGLVPIEIPTTRAVRALPALPAHPARSRTASIIDANAKKFKAEHKAWLANMRQQTGVLVKELNTPAAVPALPAPRSANNASRQRSVLVKELNTPAAVLALPASFSANNASRQRSVLVKELNTPAAVLALPASPSANNASRQRGQRGPAWQYDDALPIPLENLRWIAAQRRMGRMGLPLHEYTNTKGNPIAEKTLRSQAGASYMQAVKNLARLRMGTDSEDVLNELISADKNAMVYATYPKIQANSKIRSRAIANLWLRTPEGLEWSQKMKRPPHVPLEYLLSEDKYAKALKKLSTAVNKDMVALRLTRDILVEGLSIAEGINMCKSASVLPVKDKHKHKHFFIGSSIFSYLIDMDYADRNGLVHHATYGNSYSGSSEFLQPQCGAMGKSMTHAEVRNQIYTMSYAGRWSWSEVNVDLDPKAVLGIFVNMKEIADKKIEPDNVFYLMSRLERESKKISHVFEVDDFLGTFYAIDPRTENHDIAPIKNRDDFNERLTLLQKP